MEEQKVTKLPMVEEVSDQQYMPCGIHLVRVISVLATKEGKPISYKDKEGIIYPGITIKFKNIAGETIDKDFFYTDDAEHKCPIEFLLSRLKMAMGLNCKEQQTLEQFCKPKFWMQVAMKKITNVQGKQIFKDGKPIHFSEVTGNFYKYKEGEGKPVVNGCPGEGKEASESFVTFYARALKEGESTDKSEKKETTSSTKEENPFKDEEKVVEKKKDAPIGDW